MTSHATTTPTRNSTNAGPRTRPAPSTARIRAITVLTATLAGLAVWAISRLLGVALLIEPRPGATEPVAAPMVAISGLLAGLLGWALLAALERVLPRRAHRVWTIIAVVILVVSLSGPLTMAATAGTTASLIAMHLLVGGVLIAQFNRPRR